jgi:hypothetical protein
MSRDAQEANSITLGAMVQYLLIQCIQHYRTTTNYESTIIGLYLSVTEHTQVGPR